MSPAFRPRSCPSGPARRARTALGESWPRCVRTTHPRSPERPDAHALPWTREHDDGRDAPEHGAAAGRARVLLARTRAARRPRRHRRRDAAAGRAPGRLGRAGGRLRSRGRRAGPPGRTLAAAAPPRRPPGRRRRPRRAAGARAPARAADGHAARPGPRWAAYDVLGGAVEVGLGLRHVTTTAGPRRTRSGSCRWACCTPTASTRSRCWTAPTAIPLAEMAELAAERLLRSPSAPLRPLGDCDVVTLLASPTFRLAVVRDAVGVVGLRSAAVPVRRRGWPRPRTRRPGLRARGRLAHRAGRARLLPPAARHRRRGRPGPGGRLPRRGSPSPTRWPRSTPSPSSA